jgi:hypothetical protein
MEDVMAERVYHQEYAELHDAMKAIEARHDKEQSWPSPEVARAAKMVRMALWTLAHNPEPHGVLAEQLAKYMRELDAAKAAAGKTDH